MAHSCPAAWLLYSLTSSRTLLPRAATQAPLAPSISAATGAPYSPLDMYPVHRHPSDLNSSWPPYTMYLVTPVIWGPLLRVFRGEAFREWPLVYHCQGSWLRFPHSRRRDLLLHLQPVVPRAPSKPLLHLFSYQPWPCLGDVIVTPHPFILHSQPRALENSPQPLTENPFMPPHF